ncbi:MAG: DUF4124 domain-containing protein [Alloalcanivorax venustensis]|uniref:DUF4124 domain-containing protein n=1 Tax=Alloalcanivorax venustensis TaxID=172371 RepID=UPI001BD514B4|nr:MAG: DUF4124 domain-containing protein [Alcanivorax sp.]
MKAWWPLLLLAVPLVAGAQAQNTDQPEAGAGSNGIYRTVDADGNVVFTDNPPDKKRAEEVKVGPTNTMDSPPAERRAERRGDAPPEPPPLPDTGYEAVSITAPDAGANLRIPQDNPIQVQVSLSPSLKDGHRLVILDNGTPVEGSALDFPNPGEHTLIAQVRDSQGEVLIESEPVLFYVMRTTADSGGQGKGSAFPTFGGRAERGGSATTGGGADRGAGADRGSGAAVGGSAERVIRPSGD